MAGVAVVEPFSDHLVELMLESINERDARRARRHVLLSIGLEFEQVEIVSAILNGRCTSVSSRASSEQAHARWHRESLLATSEQDVNTERIEVHRHSGERGDRVHDEHHVRELRLKLRDVFNWVQHTCGGFAVNQRNGVEFTRGELCFNKSRRDRLAPLDLQFFSLLSAAQGYVIPFIRKGTAAAVEHFLVHEVLDGAFHDAPRGGGADVNSLSRAEKSLELGLDVSVKIGEIFAAMPNHGLAHGSISVR